MCSSLASYDESHSLFRRTGVFTILFILLILFSVPLSAQLSGSNYASSASGTGWSGLSNIAADDDNYVTTNVAWNATSEVLKVSNLGFNLPSNAVVKGIEVQMGKKRSLGGNRGIVDNLVQLGVNSSVGDNKAVNAVWSRSEVLATYGGSTDLWGTNWTASDINSSDFGVYVQVRNTRGNREDVAFIDFVQVTVYYAIRPFQVSTSSLDFGYTAPGTISEVQSFILSGIGSDGSEVTLSAPAGFQLSANSGSGFSSALVFSYSGGTLPSTTIYVRFVPSSAADYSGTITIADNGSGEPTSVAVTGTSTACSAYSTEPSNYESITNVILGSLNNSSPTNKTEGYTDYTGTVTPPVLYLDSTYPVSVTETFQNDLYGGYCKVYIDYNKDGSFDPSLENVFGAEYSGNQTMSGTVTIPSTASTGLLLMRVVVEGEADYLGALPCGTFQWGEVEDYLVEIQCPPVTFSGTLAQEGEACDGTKATMLLTGLVPQKSFIVNYSIAGIAQPAVSGITSDALGNARFETRMLTVADAGKTLQVTSVVQESTGCEVTVGASVNLQVVVPTDVAVDITADPAGPVCVGTNVTYTALVTNGGSNPSFQWYVNGDKVGTNSASYSYAPADGDKIVCLVTSNSTCLGSSNTVKVAYFSWNDTSKPLTDSDFGMDAISVDAEAQYKAGGIDGTTALAPGPTSGSTRGVDLTFDGNEPELNTAGFDYSISYQSNENDAFLFSRGSSLTIRGGNRFTVIYAVSDGAGSFVTINGDANFNPRAVGGWHDYRFRYDPTDGIGRLYVDGTQLWETPSAEVTPGMPIYWQGAGNLMVGEIMDASGAQIPSLDNLSIYSVSASQAQDSLTAQVQAFPTAVLSGSETACPHQSVGFPVLLTGTAPWTITVNDGIKDSTISNINTSPFTLQVAAGVTTSYTLTAVEDAVCSGTVSGTATLTVQDTDAPVPDRASLPDVVADCAVTSLVAPTATDNCAGTITGVADVSLPISTHGTTVVTWTYDDGNGNISTQAQNIIINGYPGETPEVVIDVSSSNHVCVNDELTFTATSNYGGSSPSFQWQIDGVDVPGATSSTFITSSLVDGNAVRCILTSNELCLQNMKDTSDHIIVQIDTINVKVTDVTSVDGSSCPDLTGSFNPDDDQYDSGYTEVTFKVESESNVADYYHYHLHLEGVTTRVLLMILEREKNGVRTVEGAIPGVTEAISNAGPGENVYCTFRIENDPGNEMNLRFYLDEVFVGQACREVYTGDNSVIHRIAAMPNIGSFSSN